MLTVRPAVRVLRASELGSWLDAEAVLAMANAEAAQIVAASSAEYQVQQQRGYAEGLTAGELEVAKALAVAHATMETVLLEMEATLPAIVVSIISDILGAMDTDALLQPALQRALGRVRRGADAVLRVGPGSVEVARATLDGLALGTAIRLELDPALEEGRCVFESSLGKAELGVEAQLRVLNETLANRWGVAA